MNHEIAPTKHEAPTGAPSREGLQRTQEIEKNLHERAERDKHSPEKAVTEARQSVKQEAISGQESSSSQSENNQSIQHIHTKADRELSFATTMNHVRRKLTGSERQLSKIIHHPTVEKVSELTGKTVARPSGVLGATSATLIGVAVIYTLAKQAGFPLSGSEMPILITVGFVLGLVVELIYKSVLNLRKKLANTNH